MLDIEVLIPTVVVRDSTTAKYCKKRNDITLEICKQNVSELYYKKGERKYKSVMWKLVDIDYFTAFRLHVTRWTKALTKPF